MNKIIAAELSNIILILCKWGVAMNYRWIMKLIYISVYLSYMSLKPYDSNTQRTSNNNVVEQNVNANQM